MSRPIRVEYEGAVYHVTARGNDRGVIFRDDRDRLRFLDTVGECAQRFGVIVHAFCLMPNHYHLVIETPRGNLSRAMGWVQATYCMRYNRRHRRSGHVVQGRFKAFLIEEDAYARRVVKYVHLNPVRPKERSKPVPADRRRFFDAYRWSSHRQYAGTAGKNEVLDWLETRWLLYWGGGKDSGKRAQKAYAADIAGCFGEVVESPLADVRGGLVLGGDNFWEKVKKVLDGRGGAVEKRWASRAGATKTRDRVRKLVKNEPDKRVRIWARVRLGGEAVSDVARELGYSDASGVHRVLQRLEHLGMKDAGVRKVMEGIRGEVGA